MPQPTPTVMQTLPPEPTLEPKLKAEAKPPTRQDADARDAADDAPSTLANANACRYCWRTTTLESPTRRRGRSRATGAGNPVNDAAVNADTQPAGVESEAEAGAALEPAS